MNVSITGWRNNETRIQTMRDSLRPAI